MKRLVIPTCFIMSTGLFCGLLLTGCNRDQSDVSIHKPSLNAVLSKETILATIPDQPSVGKDVSQGTVSEPQFSELGGGVAYTLEKDSLTQVVHNGVSGKKYTEVLYVRMSRDGKRIAYGSRTNTKWRMVVDGQEGRFFDEIGTPIFSPDGKHILYDAKLGEKWYLVIDGKMNKEACFAYFDKLFSKDSTRIYGFENSAPDNNLARVVVMDLHFKQLSILNTPGFGVKFNKDKTRFATVYENNKHKRVAVVSLSEPAIISEGQSFDEISRMAFGSDGVTLAYVGEKKGKLYLVVNDKEELLIEGVPTMLPPVPRPGSNSAALAITGKQGTSIHFAFNKSAKQKWYEEAAFPSFDASGRLYAYCARNGKKMFFVVNGKESPTFDKVLAPLFSPEGSRVVARVRKDGKRFVIVMDQDARIVHQHPPYDMVYDISFTSDGNSVAYGVKDGNKLIWKVEKL